MTDEPEPVNDLEAAILRYPLRDPEPSRKVFLLCGRCGRKMDTAVVTENNITIASARLDRQPVVERGLRPPTLRPEARVGGPGDRLIREANFTIGCHPKRCGTVVTVGRGNLHAAAMKARNRDYLFIGDGPRARERGGHDI